VIELDSEVVVTHKAPRAGPTTTILWNLPKRLAFRFFAVYLTLIIVTSQMLPSLLVIPGIRIPQIDQSSGTIRDARTWVATNVLRFNPPISNKESGSGDRPYDWAFYFLLLMTSVAVTAAWSLLDRRRPNYINQQKWFRLFLRFALGATLASYGMAKAIPLQMPYPNLTRLLTPYGHFSLQDVLWAQVGASPVYGMLTGIVELAIAVLLFVPRLTLLGALASLIATSFVFVLNMTYDIAVKLFSFHLVLMSLVLLGPDLRRLLNVLVLNRPTPAAVDPPLVNGRITRRILVCGQLALGAWLLWTNFSSDIEVYRSRGPYAPRPPLYGIWNVETMTVDGQIRVPLISDNERWRRVVVQGALPIRISFQRMDDTFSHYAATVDIQAKTMTLTPPVPPGRASDGRHASLVAQLTFQRPSPERLILDGQMEGKHLRLELKYQDRSNFELVRSGFHWFHDAPVNNP
jgi:hypothetical protein